jgi:hypothetical protein
MPRACLNPVGLCGIVVRFRLCNDDGGRQQDREKRAGMTEGTRSHREDSSERESSQATRPNCDECGV